MSDAHNEHESAIKTPKQLIVAVVAAFLVPIICIVLLVQFVTGEPKTGAGSDSQSKEAIAARVAPVADQNFKLVDANAPKQLQSGEDVFNGTCKGCHGTGANGAPKVGDKSAWGPRIGQGYDTLLAHALKGYKGMPVKGGNADLDDVEVGRAIVYMANQSGASFKEPAVPAPVASATTSASAASAAPAPAAASAPAPAAASAAASAPATADAGKKLFDSTCTACHTAGVAGAPKFGNKTDWAPRIAQGKPTLYDHALHGFKGMPPKGGSTAADADVKAAVDYMVSAASK
jgi:cytochrome c5